MGIVKQVESPPVLGESDQETADDSESDLLTQVFEHLEDDGVDVSEVNESCIPHIVEGLKNGNLAVGTSNPVYVSIGRTLRAAGVLPDQASFFE